MENNPNVWNHHQPVDILAARLRTQKTKLWADAAGYKKVTYKEPGGLNPSQKLCVPTRVAVNPLFTHMFLFPLQLGSLRLQGRFQAHLFISYMIGCTYIYIYIPEKGGDESQPPDKWGEHYRNRTFSKQEFEGTSAVVRLTCLRACRS